METLSLLQTSLQGAVLILVILLLRAATIRRLPKWTFPALWDLAVLRLLVPISIPLPIRLPSISQIAAVPEGGSTVAQDALSVPSVAVSQAVLAQTGYAFHLPILGILWGTGAFLCLLFFMLAYRRCIRSFRSAVSVEHSWIQMWQRQNALRRTIRIQKSNFSSAPLTYGILHPVVLLPRRMDWSDTNALNLILTHEYVHIRRWDGLFKLLYALALCIHWFNPLVWVMFLLVNRDLELSCDEAVLLRLGEQNRASYARTLISMEEQKLSFAPFYSSFSKNFAEERIVSIMKFKKFSTQIIALSIAMILIVGTVFAINPTEAETEAPQETSQVTVAEEQSADGRPEEVEAVEEPLQDGEVGYFVDADDQETNQAPELVLNSVDESDESGESASLSSTFASTNGVTWTQPSGDTSYQIDVTNTTDERMRVTVSYGTKNYYFYVAANSSRKYVINNAWENTLHDVDFITDSGAVSGTISVRVSTTSLG